MKFTRVLIVLVWLMAVPGCVVTGRAVSQSLNQNPHTREGAVEVSSDADAQEFYPIAFLPRGNVEEAYFLLQKGRQGRLLDQQEGTLSIDAASLNDLNDRLAVEASDMNGRVEIESGPDGPTLKVSVEDTGNRGLDYLTSWYSVSDDGRSWTLLATRRVEASLMIPLAAGFLISFGLAFAITQALKRKSKPS
mgnify:CR=1 FL=1|jgi:hypothetical protein